MTESPEDLAAVEQLLAESDALRGWLQKLDVSSVQAPSAVRDRVRADYQRRLDQLTAGLQAHGDVIAAKLSDDRAEHAELNGRAGAAREALAEAELRHAVGEYDSDRFDQERHRHGSDIETFDMALAAVTERIDRLAQIHGMVTDGARPTQAAPAGVSAGESSQPAQSASVSPPVAAVEASVSRDEPPVSTSIPVTDMRDRDADEPVAIGTLAPDADDSDMLAVFDEHVIAVEMVDPPVRAPAHTPVAEVGPLSFRPPSGAAAPPARPRSFDDMPALGTSSDVPPRFVRPGERMRPPGALPAQPPPPSQAPVEPAMSVPKPEVRSVMPTSAEVHEAAAAVQVGRTLRCGECGAMNRPLEWYCEKCGAELMAS